MSTSTPPAKEPRRDGSRTEAAVGGQPSPRLPHERDESSDAGSMARPIIEKAGDDLAAGRSNTDKGEATDAAYRKLRGG